jgi:hypothetical protein
LDELSHEKDLDDIFPGILSILNECYSAPPYSRHRGLTRKWDAETRTSVLVESVSLSEAVLLEYLRNGKAIQRQFAALETNLPTYLQEEIVKHWDFAARLALAANPGASEPVLDELAGDKQPSVRAVVNARRQRGTPEICPLPGEVLTPGELLWLLASNPSSPNLVKGFLVGETTYGDGSVVFTRWVTRHQLITKFPELILLYYSEGFLWEYSSWGNAGVFHLSLDPIFRSDFYLPHIFLREDSLQQSFDQEQNLRASLPIQR